MSVADLIAEEGVSPPVADGEAPTWPVGLRDHLSASSLGMFARCPEQWRRRYILGEKERPGEALLVGGADHAVWETNFTDKITSGVDMCLGDLEQLFAETFDQRVEREGGEKEVLWDKNPGAAKDVGVGLVRAYRTKGAPSVQPVAVEREFSVAIPGLPVPIIGRVDVEQEASLVEMKTSGQKASEPKPDWRLQGILYAHVAGKPIEWHVKTKTKVPAIYTPEDTPGLRLAPWPALTGATLHRMRLIGWHLASLYTTFGPDEPWPTSAPEHPWACGYCGYKPTCAWWGSHPSAPSVPGQTGVVTF